jgi:predicted  nucleic acid-binding Zn-ribbon protein
MGPVLDGLVKLQSVENRLRAEKAKLSRCRRNVVIQENLIRSLQNALEAKKEEVQLTKVQFDRLELELKSRDVSIAKLRASLNSTKTNKEYAAVLTQLNTTKADNSKIEAQSLEKPEKKARHWQASTRPKSTRSRLNGTELLRPYPAIRSTSSNAWLKLTTVRLSR